MRSRNGLTLRLLVLSFGVTSGFIASLAPVCLGAIICIPDDQPSIQAGIDVAVNGDTVLVSTGTYRGTGNKELNCHGKAILLLAEGQPCVLDCESTGRVISFESQEQATTVMDGFTLTNGLQDNFEYGAGILCTQASPTIRNCRIYNNVGYYFTGGGGVHLADASPTFINCVITDNTSNDSGGGVACLRSSPVFLDCTITKNFTLEHGGGVFIANGAPVFSNCTILHNSTDRYLSEGGGVFIDNASVAFTHCDVTHNQTHEGGGGIACSRSTLSLIGCTITENSSDFYGGGGIACSQSSLSLFGCAIADNASGYYGGGMSSNRCDLVIQNCSISRNMVTGQIATYDHYVGGGLLCLGVNGTVRISGSLINDNRLADGVSEGGGIFNSDCDLFITNTVIMNNLAPRAGGGIYCVCADEIAAPMQVQIINCVIADNTSGEGAGIVHHEVENAPSLISNCTIVNNTARVAGGGVWYETQVTTPVIWQSILWGNVPEQIHAQTIRVGYSDVQGGFEGIANFNADPLFTTGMQGFCYLSDRNAGQARTSPCIDAGNSEAASTCFETPDGALCMDSLTVRSDQQQDSGKVDIGAHFFRDDTNDLGMLWDVPYSAHPGEDFWASAYLVNPGATLDRVPVVFVLQWLNSYWFWPSWTYYTPASGIDYRYISAQHGSVVIEVVPRFAWPDTGADVVGGLCFYGAAFTEDLMTIRSSIAAAYFGWEPGSDL